MTTEKEEEQKEIQKNMVGVFNDLEAAEVVIKLFPHFVCCKGVLYCFNDLTGQWVDTEETIFKIISRFNDKLYLLTLSHDGKKKKGTKGYGNSTVLQRQMLPQLKTLCVDDDWINNTQFTSLGKLLYSNGYLDMKTGLFYTEYNPDIVFFYKIPMCYDPARVK